MRDINVSSFADLKALKKEELVRAFDERGDYDFPRIEYLNEIRSREQNELNKNMLNYTIEMNKTARSMEKMTNIITWLTAITVGATLVNILLTVLKS